MDDISEPRDCKGKLFERSFSHNTYPIDQKWKNSYAVRGAYEIVGTPFRSEYARHELRKKKKGNTVYLIRHPNNKHDENAIGVYIASDDDSIGNGFNLVHVGYIRASTAKHLSEEWPTYEGVPLVVMAKLEINDATTKSFSISNETAGRIYYN